MMLEKKKIKTLPQTICSDRRGKNFTNHNRFDESVKKKNILLHSCCGPCSTAVVEQLAEEFDVTVFFYNPCITDEAEYQKRRDAQIEYIKKFNEENMGKTVVFFKESDYRPGSFYKLTEGHENDSEGGARCRICFQQRMEKTAEVASLSGFDFFTTTLTVSPHKNFKIISEIGKTLALRYGLTFLDRDFKKKNGFGRSVELSKKYGLYRQNYCGCEYSKRLGDD